MLSREEIETAFMQANKINLLFIKSNDLKKGDLIKMKGTDWYGQIIDNGRGNIRYANIHGFCSEMGSIYAWDIWTVCKDAKFYYVELTDKQQSDQKKCADLGFC